MKFILIVFFLTGLAVCQSPITEVDQRCAKFIATTAGLPRKLLSTFTIFRPTSIFTGFTELQTLFGAEMQDCIDADRENVRKVLQAQPKSAVNVVCGMNVLGLICRAGLCAKNVVLHNI